MKKKKEYRDLCMRSKRGRKLKFKEKTTTVSYRIPVSKKNEMENHVFLLISKWERDSAKKS